MSRLGIALQNTWESFYIHIINADWSFFLGFQIWYRLKKSRSDQTCEYIVALGLVLCMHVFVCLIVYEVRLHSDIYMHASLCFPVGFLQVKIIEDYAKFYIVIKGLNLAMSNSQWHRKHRNIHFKSHFSHKLVTKYHSVSLSNV